jgi:hypothetical protein
MVTYQYNCADDGPTDVSLPMGTAADTIACPTCSQPARRIFTSPMLSAADHNRMRLIDSTMATSDRPEVVTSIPSAGRRKQQPMAPPDPRLQKLPRP